MSLFEIIVLAIIQGLTEFLPISSSAHLLLPAELLGWQTQGLAFDVAVHVGSLVAVMFYFRQDIVRLTQGWFGSVTGSANEEGTLAWGLIFATLPAVIVGFLAKDIIELYLRGGWVIAITTIFFALLLWWADLKAKQLYSMPELGWKKAIIIGIAQVFALIPGTSRSGITMTAGLMVGLNRETAARFSFLLSIPVILGAGALQTKDLIQQPDAVNWTVLGLGALLSFVSAYLCITLFLKWISRIGMLPFVIYRLILGFGIAAFLLLN